MYISAYFYITPPNQYSFLGYYQYRIKQIDFTFSFQKEASTLRKNLETILNYNNNNPEIIKSVKILKETFKNHRTRFREVDKFWNDMENEYLHEKLSIEEKELQLDELKIARVITQGTSKATATVMENVDAKLKFNRKHSLSGTDEIGSETVKKTKSSIENDESHTQETIENNPFLRSEDEYHSASCVPESENDDGEDYIQSDIEDQNHSTLLLSSQLEGFHESYKKMSKAKKWVLSSGKCVEDTIFEHCKQQPVESLLHSWIIDLDDREAESLFTAKEWNEVRHVTKELPEMDYTFAASMMRFSDVKTTNELRKVLEETSFKDRGEPYDRVKHYDAEWAEIVMRKFLTCYEDPNETLQKQHLESWYDINVWSLIIDHGLSDVIGLETVRKESSCVAVTTRKNRKRACTRHKNPVRKKMGYRMDGIFRMYVDNIEYGAIEVAKKFEATKLLTDGFKLTKAMHDIIVCLNERVHFDEMKARQLRVAGMLHMGLKSQVLQLCSPKGYVSILSREKLLEVPVSVEKIKDLIRVLASVWKMKKMIVDCVKTVNMKTQDQTDFLQEIMGTVTPPPTIVFPWSIDT